eukprot:gene27015-35722_t
MNLQLPMMKLMEIAHERSTFSRTGPAPLDAPHEVVFAIRQLDLAALDALLMERSTPHSPLYQQWLSFEEIGQLYDSFSSASFVVSWLSGTGAEVTWHSPHWTYLVARANISTWQSLLNTTFHTHIDKQSKSSVKSVHHRAAEYYLPQAVAEHVTAVFNTVQTPPVIPPKFRQRDGGGDGRIHVEKATLRYREGDAKRSGPGGPELAATGTGAEESTAQHSAAAGLDPPNRVACCAVLPSASLTVQPAASYTYRVTISFLDSFYQVSSNKNNGSSRMSQSVFETNSEYYSPSDLTLFQQQYGLTVQAAVPYNGHNTSQPCSLTGGSPSCTEGNLDIQYIMGMAQVSTSIYWYTSSASSSTYDPFTTWILAVAADPNPPQSNSLSWGAYEYSVSSSIQNTWNTEASKLGLQGVSVIAASGDDGAPNASSKGCMCGTNSGYNPVFPASSPYTTAVGATMGPQSGSAEVACQSQLGGVITSGGGFSMYNARPSWQNSAVSNYFAAVSGSSSAPAAGYNSQGRGYPDVSLIGVNYQVVIAGVTVGVYGTSCSTPVFAGLITLLNGQRKASGLNSVGFMNPTLYNASYAKKYNDITSGSNKCCAYTGSNPANAQCCTTGFTAIAGWDPVTGFGSITYPNLASMFRVNATYQAAAQSSSSSGSGLSALSIVLIVFAVLVGLGLLVTSVVLGARWWTKTNRSGHNDVITAAEVRIINNNNIDGGPVPLTINPTRMSPPKSADSFALGTAPNPRESDVQALQGLGFSREAALNALQRTGNDLQRSADLLTSS